MRSKSVEQIGLGFDLTVANGIQPEQCFFLLYLHDKRWKLLLLIGYLETVLLLKSSRASFSLFMALPGTGGSWEAEKDLGALHTSRLFPFVSFPGFFHPRD